MSTELQSVVTLQPIPAIKGMALTNRRIVDSVTPGNRQQTAAFKTVLSYLLGLPVAKEATSHRIAEFQRLFGLGKLPNDVAAALALVRGKKASVCPNQATLYRWVDDLERYANGNLTALTKKHTGRIRTVWGWEQKAVELFNLPTKPGYADVAFWLRTDYGFETATKSRVTRYLQTMPATLGKQSPGRMGQTFYKHNLSPYKIRDNDVLPVGFGYEGDGHTVDVYVAHPVTGNLYRPELTLWIDVRSRFVVGWYLDNDESAITTLFAISEALTAHDHVPAVLFLDNGSGFKSRMMTDEVSGFFSRLSITPSFSLPGNSKGKGLVEGFFKLFRNRHDKKEAFKGSYCGHDMAPEIIRRLPDLVKRGKRQLPSLAEYAASVGKFIDDYNREPKPVLEGKCPLDVWGKELLRVPVHIPADALVWPRAVRTVTKWRIRLDNRFYEAAELAQYNGSEVLVEYSLHHDHEIRVLDDKERLVCIAQLVGKVGRKPESRLDELTQKREAGQIRRKENQIAEIQQRNKPVVTIEDRRNALSDIIEYTRVEDMGTGFNPKDCLFIGAETEEEVIPAFNYKDFF